MQTPSVFEEAADALHSLLPPELGPLQCRAHRYGVKAWLGESDRAPREHYEAQVVGPRHVTGATTLAIEVGFHAEHPDQARNQAALDVLVAGERRWRRELGDDAVAGPFLGRETWRRLSETWADPDLGEPELALEVAARLTDYITALEPLRRVDGEQVIGGRGRRGNGREGAAR